MIHLSSLNKLETILSDFKSKLSELDKNAKRDKNLDYKLRSKSELTALLNSNIPLKDKKTLLLSEIGYVRINLFMEYNARISLLEQNNQMDDAVELMNEYVTNVAIPFIPNKASPDMVNRIKDAFHMNRQLEPHEWISDWKRKYTSWIEGQRISQMNEGFQLSDYEQLKITYRMLYAVSFSSENFPPGPTIIFYDPTRIKVK